MFKHYFKEIIADRNWTDHITDSVYTFFIAVIVWIFRLGKGFLMG